MTNYNADFTINSKEGKITVSISESMTLETMQLMCEQSLSPEVFEQWMNVRGWLEKTRKDLK